jgi:hypothetical protein
MGERQTIDLTEGEIVNLFTHAGITILRVWELANQYWPRDNETFVKLRADSPWWLVKTPAGCVRVGGLRRVLEIDWSDTGIRIETPLTADNVVVTESSVRAANVEKALEYLTDLAPLIAASAHGRHNL